VTLYVTPHSFCPIYLRHTDTNDAERHHDGNRQRSTCLVDSVTLTSHVAAASSSAANNSQLGASSLSHTTSTMLIILAGSRQYDGPLPE